MDIKVSNLLNARKRARDHGRDGIPTNRPLPPPPPPPPDKSDQESIEDSDATDNDRSYYIRPRYTHRHQPQTRPTYWPSPETLTALHPRADEPDMNDSDMALEQEDFDDAEDSIEAALAAESERLRALYISDVSASDAFAPTLNTKDSWLDPANALLEHYESDEEMLARNSIIPTREEALYNELFQNKSTEGLQRERSIRRTIHSFGLKLSDAQKRFVEAALGAMRPLIYGKDYESSIDEIYKRVGEKQTLPWWLMQTPRRFGKTTIVAMIVAAVAAWVPGIKIAIFSTGLSTSTKLMKEVKRFLSMIPECASRFGLGISVDNSKELHIIPPGCTNERSKTCDPNLVSHIYSFTSNARTGRGFTADVSIIDEAAHIDNKLWKETIVPALGTVNHVMLGISTAQGPTNFFSILQKAKNSDTGGPLFGSICISMACDSCQNAGRPEKCTHNSGTQPSWKPADTQRRIQDLLGEADKNIYNQEVLGMIVDDKNLYLDGQSIVRFELRPVFMIDHQPFTIYSFIDPHGQGQTSSQAIVSLITVGQHTIVSIIHTFFLICSFILHSEGA